MSEKVATLKRKADKKLQEKYVPMYPACLVCLGETSEMHHFVPKSQSNNLRYDPLNLIPLCRKCHARHHLSGDPAIVAKIIQVKGQDWVDDLQKRRSEICKLTPTTLREILDKFDE